MLIEQKYGDKSEWKKHFYHLLPAFKDRRYIKVGGKPLFMIYKEEQFPHIKEFIQYWNDLAKENGLDGLYFIAHKPIDLNSEMVNRVLAEGFDAVNTVGLWASISRNRGFVEKCIDKLRSIILRLPNVFDYERMSAGFISEIDKLDNVYPTLIPNWDHTPRSGRAGYLLIDSTPQLFAKHIKQVFSIVKQKPKDRQIVFLKSWNEWGEGNYMEPDLKFGKGYIESLKEEILNYEKDE